MRTGFLLLIFCLSGALSAMAVEGEGWDALPGPKSKSLDYALNKAKEKNKLVFLVVYDPGPKDWKHLQGFVRDGDTERILKDKFHQVLCDSKDREIQDLLDARIRDRFSRGDIIYIALTPDRKVLCIGLVFHFRAGAVAMKKTLENYELLKKGQPFEIHQSPL